MFPNVRSGYCHRYCQTALLALTAVVRVTAEYRTHSQVNYPNLPRKDFTPVICETADTPSNERETPRERGCLFFVEDLTPREATGDIVGLSLGTHRRRVSGQVTSRRY